MVELYNFYGDYIGSRVARKHLGWYLKANYLHPSRKVEQFRRTFNQIACTQEQLLSIQDFFNCPLVKHAC